MTRKYSTRSGNRTPSKRSPKAMLMAWALFSMTICSGCRTTVRHLAADRAPIKIEPGLSYSFTNAGWYVPDALMLDITRELSEKRLELERAAAATKK